MSVTLAPKDLRFLASISAFFRERFFLRMIGQRSTIFFNSKIGILYFFER